MTAVPEESCAVSDSASDLRRFPQPAITRVSDDLRRTRTRWELAGHSPVQGFLRIDSGLSNTDWHHPSAVMTLVVENTMPRYAVPRFFQVRSDRLPSLSGFHA